MGASYAAVTDVLKEHDKERAETGGMRPCDLLAKVKAATKLSRATVYRHLKAFRDLGLLDKFRVPGHPQAGPRTRVRYLLKHALWRTWEQKLADDARRRKARQRPPSEAPPAQPQAAPATPERAPPAEPGGVRSGREWLKARGMTS